MSTTIRYGVPGSYKTSNAVENCLIPKILEGRPVMTNIRGVDVDYIIKTFAEGRDIKPNVFFVPGTDDDFSHQLFRFAHRFIPIGTFLVIDEVQLVYPLDRRPTRDDEGFSILSYSPDDFSTWFSSLSSDWRVKIEAFNQSVEMTAAQKAQLSERPLNLKMFFDKQRHFNWDISATATDTESINKHFLTKCEQCLSYTNQATKGLSGFLEVNHKCTSKAPSAVINKRTGHIDPKVFAAYQSTATGIVTDTVGHFSLLKSWKFIAAVGFLLFLGLVVLGYSLFAPSLEDTVKGTSKALTQDSSNSQPSASGSVLSSQPASNIEDTIFAGNMYVASVISGNVNFILESGSYISYAELLLADYSLKKHGNCFYSLFYKDEFVRYVTCKPYFSNRRIPSPSRNLNSQF